MTGRGKVFILTGASRGIGLAIARYLFSQQSKVLLVARNESALKQIASEYGDQAAVLVGDFSDMTLAQRAVDMAEQKWSRVDGVIVNHGVLDPVTRIADSNINDWRSAFDVNYFAAVSLAQASIPALRKSNGTIIFTSSGAAVSGYPTWGAYGSAKAALNHLAMTLGNEERDIASFSIRPGVVDTQMQNDIREKHHTVMDEKDRVRFAELKTSGGLLRPEQPGHVIAKLALSPPRDLSGKFLSWNADELKQFQE